MSVAAATPAAEGTARADEVRASERQLERFLAALDARSMGGRLAEAVGAASTTCAVLDAKYLPGERATVLYDLGGRLLRGTLVPEWDSAATSRGIEVDPGLSIHVFPDDPDLPSLRRVTDPLAVGPRLAVALGRGARFDDAGAVSACRTALLRYRPGKRATMLIEYRSGGDRYIAKAYHDSSKAAAVAHESDALASAARSATLLKFATMAAHLPELGVVVQREVSGTPLTSLLDTRNGPAAAAEPGVRRAARALAELHRTSPATKRQRSVVRELRRFSERAARIGEVAPAPGDALSGLAARLTHLEPQIPEAELGTVHGDCKPSQFLLGQYVNLLDVDHLGVSDVAADPGTFIASLRQQAARRRLSRNMPATEAYDHLAAVFLDEYLMVRECGRGARARIHWQEAVALERKALRAFARAPRSPLAQILVAQAHRRLDILGEKP